MVAGTENGIESRVQVPFWLFMFITFLIGIFFLVRVKISEQIGPAGLGEYLFIVGKRQF